MEPPTLPSTPVGGASTSCPRSPPLGSKSPPSSCKSSPSDCATSPASGGGRFDCIAANAQTKAFRSQGKFSQRNSGKGKLARRVLALLREKPEGMCGGLLNQRLKEQQAALLWKVYGTSSGCGDLQKGWLYDVMRTLPEVDKCPMGRDTWYSLPAHLLEAPAKEFDDEDEPLVQEMTSQLSEVASEEGLPLPPHRETLAGCIRMLLQESPEGMSGSALGLRLRRMEPRAVEEFYAEATPGDKKPTVHDLVRSVPGVVASARGGNVLYTLKVSDDVRHGVSSGSSFLRMLVASLVAQYQLLVNAVCGKRAKKA